MNRDNTLTTDDFYALKDIDLYNVLCITMETYTPEIVKKKYRKLSIKYHPDKNREEGANDKFTLIQLAYSILSNEQKKAMYDLVRSSENTVEDYDELKKQNKDELFIPKISDEEFARNIDRFNAEIDEEYGKNKGKLSDIEVNKLMQINRNENLLPLDMKTKFEEDFNKLKNIGDEKAKRDAFNAMFDVAHVDEEDEVHDLMLYNGNTTLMNYNVGTTNNYSSMFYQGEGSYEDSFKITSTNLKEELDERSYEEQMAEYENATQDLYEISKTSTLKNGRADFRFDHM